MHTVDCTCHTQTPYWSVGFTLLSTAFVTVLTAELSQPIPQPANLLMPTTSHPGDSPAQSDGSIEPSSEVKTVEEASDWATGAVPDPGMLGS